MKKNTIILIIAAAFIAPALNAADTAAPSPTPTPATIGTGPATPAITMTLPPSTTAAVAAAQIIQQVTTLLTQVSQVIDNGVSAQPGQPEITAKDLQAALGANNVMRLRSAVAILSESAPPTAATPTPTPKKK